MPRLAGAHEGSVVDNCTVLPCAHEETFEQCRDLDTSALVEYERMFLARARQLVARKPQYRFSDFQVSLRDAVQLFLEDRAFAAEIGHERQTLRDEERGIRVA